MRHIALSTLLLVSCVPPAMPVAPAPVVEPRLNPAANADSTFQVQVKTDSEQWVGTGWIVNVRDDVTYLVTAGHVCTADETARIWIMDRNTQTTPVVQVRFMDQPDLCILMAPVVLGAPLALATQMPDYGDEVAYLGGA